MPRAVLSVSSVARYWQAFPLTLHEHHPDMNSNRVSRTSGAAGDRFQEDGREVLAMLRSCRQTIQLVLVALTDGVEMELWADGLLRRRSRFLRDTEARKYSERLTARLTRRGYGTAAELR